jgi:hypothetical protein
VSGAQEPAYLAGAMERAIAERERMQDAGETAPA